MRIFLFLLGLSAYNLAWADRCPVGPISHVEIRSNFLVLDQSVGNCGSIKQASLELLSSLQQAKNFLGGEDESTLNPEQVSDYLGAINRSTQNLKNLLSHMENSLCPQVIGEHWHQLISMMEELAYIRKNVSGPNQLFIDLEVGSSLANIEKLIVVFAKKSKQIPFETGMRLICAHDHLITPINTLINFDSQKGAVALYELVNASLEKRIQTLESTFELAAKAKKVAITAYTSQLIIERALEELEKSKSLEGLERCVALGTGFYSEELRNSPLIQEFSTIKTMYESIAGTTGGNSKPRILPPMWCLDLPSNDDSSIDTVNSAGYKIAKIFFAYAAMEVKDSVEAVIEEGRIGKLNTPGANVLEKIDINPAKDMIDSLKFQQWILSQVQTFQGIDPNSFAVTISKVVELKDKAEDAIDKKWYKGIAKNIKKSARKMVLETLGEIKRDRRKLRRLNKSLRRKSIPYILDHVRKSHNQVLIEQTYRIIADHPGLIINLGIKATNLKKICDSHDRFEELVDRISKLCKLVDQNSSTKMRKLEAMISKERLEKYQEFIDWYRGRQ